MRAVPERMYPTVVATRDRVDKEREVRATNLALEEDEDVMQEDGAEEYVEVETELIEFEMECSQEQDLSCPMPLVAGSNPEQTIGLLRRCSAPIFKRACQMPSSSRCICAHRPGLERSSLNPSSATLSNHTMCYDAALLPCFPAPAAQMMMNPPTSKTYGGNSK